jgi:glycosyltransferase involved in cell wall biosynthesis
MSAVDGVNFFGSWETSDGIGRAAALNIECLQSARIPLDSFVLSRPVALQSGRDTVIDDHLVSELRYKTNIFQFSARWVPHYFARLGEGDLNGFYNIGYWVCETPTIPEYWAQQARYFDEIWTASKFCQDAISKSVRIPVITIPHPVQNQSPTQRIEKSRAGASHGCFNFLTVFNTFSDAERKNILFCIRAFLEAHGTTSNVRLTVKVSNLEHDQLLAKKLSLITRKYSNIHIISGYVKDSEIQHLYDNADAYVSLHRAEGFGLTISDAISRGIPVITTGYSGNMEFCEAADIRIVRYELREVGHDRLRYRRNDVWAEPDLEDAVAAFRDIADNYMCWLRKAMRARERVTTQFGTHRVANMMLQRLQLICSKFSYTSDMENRKTDRDVGIFETYGF